MGLSGRRTETRVATALYDGHVADYAECPEYVFADARPMLARQDCMRGRTSSPGWRRSSTLAAIAFK